ncbi:phage tail tape measure protein, partial [Lactobacillus acetotolerans]|uniref:phage tail tape measure protein n=1 Tax=Lactobacillus acetotolerans TaxID=1600 RepID=UPI002FDB524F
MADGYSRSAKVGFSIVAKNLEDLTKTNDLFDSLIKKGKKADSILSNLGSHYSNSGLSKFKDGLSGVNDQLDKITDKSKDFASSMNGHLKSVADDSNKSAGRMSSAFSKATDKIKHGMDSISDNKEIKFKTNTSQLQRDFKKVQYQTDRAKDSLYSMRNQLDRNNNSIKLASREHDSYVNALKSEGNYTKASREELKGLRTSYSQLSKQLDKEKNYLAKVRNATGKTSDAYMKQSTKVNELRSHVASTKNEMARMNVTANRSHTAFGRLYNAGSKLSNMGTTVTMAMIPVAAAFKRAADEAVNLQNRYTTVRNLLYTGGESPRAAKAETKAMQKENNGFALKYGVSPVDMAKGGEELIRRGYNGKQELGAHEYFLQAARASGDPYLSVVGNAAPALESFGYKNRAGNSVKKMKDYTKLVTNQMAYASDLSATNFSGMGEALKYASQVAHSAHESLASTTAAVGIMSNRGLDGSLAGTGLRKVINAFASPNLKGQQGSVMDKYHIKQSGFYNKNGQLKSLPSLLDYINHQTRHLTSSKKDDFARKFFGTTGQQAGLDLMELTGKKGSRSTNNLRGLTARVANAQNMYGGRGYEERLAKKNMSSWQNQIKQFKQYLNIMGMGFAKTVLPAFTKALHLSNKLLGVLIKTPSPIKKLVGFTTAFAGILASAYATSRLLRHGLNFLNGGSLF